MPIWLSTLFAYSKASPHVTLMVVQVRTVRRFRVWRVLYISTNLFEIVCRNHLHCHMIESS